MRPPLMKSLAVGDDGGETAHPGTGDHPYSDGIRAAHFEASVIDGLNTSGDSELGEEICFAQPAIAEPRAWVEALDLHGKADFVIACVKARDGARATGSVENALPKLFPSIPDRGNRPYAGDDDAARAHAVRSS